MCPAQRNIGSHARRATLLFRRCRSQDGYYEDLCFHAQQAAEKAIKAIYVRYPRLFSACRILLKKRIDDSEPFQAAFF